MAPTVSTFGIFMTGDYAASVSVSLELPAEFAVKDCRAARAALRHQRIARYRPHAHPTQALVQPCGVAAGDGVEHEQSFSTIPRRGLGGPHERRPQPLTADAAMHQHLRQIGAVRLVLRLVQ